MRVVSPQASSSTAWNRRTRSRLPGLDDDARSGRNGAQGAEVGVVHVGVREQDGVERRQLALAERGLDQPAGPQLGEAAAEADAALEHRIGERPACRRS